MEIDQEANDIVNDPVNNVLYLSVPGAAPTNGNTISVISLASALDNVIAVCRQQSGRACDRR